MLWGLGEMSRQNHDKTKFLARYAVMLGANSVKKRRFLDYPSAAARIFDITCSE